MVKVRIAIGAALIAGLLLTIWADEKLGGPYFASVLILIPTLMGQDELVRMMRGRRPGFWIIVQSTAVLTIGAALVDRIFRWTDHPTEIDLFAIVFGLSVVLAQKVFAFERGTREDVNDHLADVACAALSLLYVLAPMALLQFLTFMPPAGYEGQGTRFACAVVLISKCGDIGGYLVGTFAGKRRILPRVSPKKSYEGSIGGLALTIAAVFLLAPQFPWLSDGVGVLGKLVFAVVINLSTQAGDFAESMLKRTCGVKDSAAVLPTFGGALDIIDSLVFAVPAAFFLFRLAGA